MVVPLAAAAAQAGSAGATALGLGMGKTDLDLTRDLFKLQMRQAKRLWTADWAEASVRHGEACLQSAQQHAEAQALSAATYFQAERLAAQSIQLSRDQDSRSFEMAWRSEVREMLRDELTNQNSRFNIIMLCDTVCLSCVFSLIADGSPPEDSSELLIIIYLFSLGLSITLFSVSLWCSVVVVRRLHEHTAAILEQKLFSQSDDLQEVWQHQVQQNLPTGPHVMHLLNRAYEKWLASYIDPIGRTSIHLMSVGVVAMFVTAGLLTHLRYLVEYNNNQKAVFVFWATVFSTSTAVIYMKYQEDSIEKRKEGVYDNSWQDGLVVNTNHRDDAATTNNNSNHKNCIDCGPYAKIVRAADTLFNTIRLGTTERVENLGTQEQRERELCAKTKSLHTRVERLRYDSERRAQTRRDVLQLLTTAAEELDALPEDLTARLNKILHDIDEADLRTAQMISMPLDSMLAAGLGHPASTSQRPERAAMGAEPVDAQRIPISLVAVRKKLGEIPHTTLLRIQNLSDEPLRLKSGLQLKSGSYIKSLDATDQDGNSICYHLYPISEIPPRKEVAISARSGGNNWIATSGIDGEIVYTNRDETWNFKIRFQNTIVKSFRKCRVKAISVSQKSAEKSNDHSSFQASETEIHASPREYWTIYRDEIDRKVNNEVLVTIDCQKGDEALKAEQQHRDSLIPLKAGHLLKNRASGLRLTWHKRWFVLTPSQLMYSEERTSKKKSAINIRDITQVRIGSGLGYKNVLEIHVKTEGREPYLLAASTPTERDDWIRQISGVAAFMDRGTSFDNDLEANNGFGVDNEAFECVDDPTGTQVFEASPRSFS